jgi:hypothetical protein
MCVAHTSYGLGSRPSHSEKAASIISCTGRASVSSNGRIEMPTGTSGGSGDADSSVRMIHATHDGS